MLHSKRIWILAAGLLIFVGAAALVFLDTQTRTTTVVESDTELSKTEIIQLAQDALAIEYSGTPEQVTIGRSTVGAVNKFHCGKIGAMISAIVSPLQGNPDICAPDSTLWVVSLRGEFQHEGFVTDSVQIVLDRAGRLMSMDSGELTSISW